ncbi:MAG: baseplate J/gp47 family protein [Planctomycetes bacterium]|nr:baseplate J/gp47 family protein [Planctomycetota bacterium]
MNKKRKRAPTPAEPPAPLPGPAPAAEAGSKAREETHAPPALEAVQEARRVFERLLEKLRQLCPGWAGGLEDPAAVLLELWAELSGELRVQVGRLEDRLLERLFDRLLVEGGLEPRGPFPARGAVRFLPGPALAGSPAKAERVPAGTPVSAPRSPGAPKAVFETAADCWVSAAGVKRAYAVAQNQIQVIPLSGGEAPGMKAVKPFGERSGPERFLFLGDEQFESLREGPGPVLIDWPALELDLAGAAWEYSGRQGWRSLSPLFEVNPAPPEKPGKPERAEKTEQTEKSCLRMAIFGPLPDLEREKRGEASLPWIRASLPAKKDLRLSIPSLASAAGGSRGQKSAAAPRPVDRIFAESGGLLEDFSQTPLPMDLARRPDRLDPAVYFGFEQPVPASFHLELAGEEEGYAPAGEGAKATAPIPAPGPLRLWSRQPPRWSWEFSDGKNWRPFPEQAVLDRTASLQASGSVHLQAPDSWAPMKVLGEPLFWVRARWGEGEYLHPPAVRMVCSHAVEVVQGSTLRRLAVIPRGEEGWGGWIEAPALAGAAALPFDRLLVEPPAGKTEIWERLLPGDLPRGRDFLLRRDAAGRFWIHFGDRDRPQEPAPAPPAEARVWIESVRAEVGAHGNLPAGTVLAIEAGLPFLAAVESIGPTRGGADLETAAELRRRAQAAWSGGERAVTAADFQRLARALLPEVRRVEVYPDPLHPGGVLVTVLPEAGTFLVPAALTALEQYLLDRSFPGLRVRVIEGVAVPAVLELEFSENPGGRGASLKEPGRLEELAAWAGSVLRSRLESGGGRPAASGKTAPAVAIFPILRLEELPVREVIASALTGTRQYSRLKLESARWRRHDNQEILVMRRPMSGNVGEAGDPANLGGLHNGFYRIYIELKEVKPQVN